MTLVRTQELLDTAVNSGVGVAAFNVIALEHAEQSRQDRNAAPLGALKIKSSGSLVRELG